MNKAITDIRFRVPQTRPNDELIALVDIILMDAIKLRDIQLCKSSENVLYLIYPRRRTVTGGYYSLFNPLNRKSGDKFTRAILQAYKRHIKG